MAKTRIHDLAAEFGIETEQLLKLLAELDIHVRSHLSALDVTQVSLVRARWEREKRKASQPATKRRRRTTKKKTTTKKTEEAPAEVKPKRRRRTAAEVQAKADVVAAEEAEAEAVREKQEALQPLKVDDDKPEVSLAERAAALFGEAPPEAPAELTPEPAAPPVSEPVRPAASAAPSAPAPPAAVEPPAPAGPTPPPRIPRPTPVTRGIKPVASSAPIPGPRPIASAAPGDAAEERRRDRKKRGKKGKKTSTDHAAVQANISRTMASIKGSKKKGARRRDDEPSFREREEQRIQEEKERERTLVRVNEFITVSELADTLKVSSTEIVGFCFKELAMMVTVNQRLDFDQIELIAGEFGFDAVRDEEYTSEKVAIEPEEDPDDLKSRPPVVTVMGHVDHGKTSLLDYVRKANVIAGEAGGITQHIGAYHVEVEGGKVITFLDTPGHEAFTAMRARGTQVTDLVVLVVAADDQVMPQTVEAISHARNAGVPMIVAINKIDLPSANVEKVKQDLLKHEVILEDFGGEALSTQISAKTGQGIDELLEQLLLQAELLDLKANPTRPARGTVIESSLDPGKGPVATILVEAGTLKAGDDFICGNLAGRVRAMLDERGKRVKVAGPSIPVQVLGFDGVPHGGDSFTVVANANEAREVAQKRQRLDREAAHRRTSRGVSLEDISRHLESGAVRSLNIIIKADQAGPAEAMADAFAQLSTDEVRVEVVHRGVGAISEGDVVLARAANAIIVGFHVRPDSNARLAAEREKIDVRTYRVIYEAVEDVKSALEGLLSPEEKETVLGEAEVLQLFKISSLGTIAGCVVRNGLVRRSARVRVLREGVDVYDGQLASLKRFKEDVREVKDGLECGLSVEKFNDLKVGDTIQAYTVEQVARSLETAGATKGG